MAATSVFATLGGDDLSSIDAKARREAARLVASSVPTAEPTKPSASK